MSSWLSNRLGIHWNLRPLAAPTGAIVGGLLGGPIGAGIGAGLMKSGDNLAHGDSLGHALGQGVLNGALAYGTAGLLNGPPGSSGNAVAGMPGPQFTPAANVIQGPGSAAMNLGTTTGSNLGASAVQKGVMDRVMGGAGNALSKTGQFIKNNHSTLETVGQGAQGILSAQAQNKQLGIEQQRANAESAQIQAALDKQKAVAGAFAQMYGQKLGHGAAPSTPNVPTPSRSLAPSTPARFSYEEQPGDGNGTEQANDGAPQGGGNPPVSTKANDPTLSVLSRLGYVLPPSSDYAGNSSMYGSPYGYGYTSMGGY